MFIHLSQMNEHAIFSLFLLCPCSCSLISKLLYTNICCCSSVVSTISILMYIFFFFSLFGFHPFISFVFLLLCVHLFFFFLFLAVRFSCQNHEIEIDETVLCFIFILIPLLFIGIFVPFFFCVPFTFSCCYCRYNTHYSSTSTTTINVFPFLALFLLLMEFTSSLAYYVSI